MTTVEESPILILSGDEEEEDNDVDDDDDDIVVVKEEKIPITIDENDDQEVIFVAQTKAPTLPVSRPSLSWDDDDAEDLESGTLSLDLTMGNLLSTPPAPTTTTIPCMDDLGVADVVANDDLSIGHCETKRCLQTNLSLATSMQLSLSLDEGDQNPLDLSKTADSSNASVDVLAPVSDEVGQSGSFISSLDSSSFVDSSDESVNFDQVDNATNSSSLLVSESTRNSVTAHCVTLIDSQASAALKSQGEIGTRNSAIIGSPDASGAVQQVVDQDMNLPDSAVASSHGTVPSVLDSNVFAALSSAQAVNKNLLDSSCRPAISHSCTSHLTKRSASSSLASNSTQLLVDFLMEDDFTTMLTPSHANSISAATVSASSVPPSSLPTQEAVAHYIIPSQGSTVNAPIQKVQANNSVQSSSGKMGYSPSLPGGSSSSPQGVLHKNDTLMTFCPLSQSKQIAVAASIHHSLVNNVSGASSAFSARDISSAPAVNAFGAASASVVNIMKSSTVSTSSAVSINRVGVSDSPPSSKLEDLLTHVFVQTSPTSGEVSASSVLVKSSSGTSSADATLQSGSSHSCKGQPQTPLPASSASPSTPSCLSATTSSATVPTKHHSVSSFSMLDDSSLPPRKRVRSITHSVSFSAGASNTGPSTNAAQVSSMSCSSHFINTYLGSFESTSCEKCQTRITGMQLSRCSLGHRACGQCLEEQVKLVLTGRQKGSLKCITSNCNSFYPMSELKHSLPNMVVEILEDKLDRDYVEFISDLMLSNAVSNTATVTSNTKVCNADDKNDPMDTNSDISDEEDIAKVKVSVASNTSTASTSNSHPTGTQPDVEGQTSASLSDDSSLSSFSDFSDFEDYDDVICDDKNNKRENRARGDKDMTDEEMVSAPKKRKKSRKDKDKSSKEDDQEKQKDFPDNWVQMDSTTSLLAVPLKPDSDEYIQVAFRFYSTMTFPQADITQILRIQNPILWKYYSLKRLEMVQENEGLRVEEKLLFHGTKCSVIDAICRKGFDWRVCGKHGTAYGQGCYFAQDSAYSHNYTDRNNDGHQSSVLLRSVSASNRCSSTGKSSCSSHLHKPASVTLASLNPKPSHHYSYRAAALNQPPPGPPIPGGPLAQQVPLKVPQALMPACNYGKTSTLAKSTGRSQLLAFQGPNMPAPSSPVVRKLMRLFQSHSNAPASSSLPSHCQINSNKDFIQTLIDCYLQQSAGKSLLTNLTSKPSSLGQAPQPAHCGNPSATQSSLPPAHQQFSSSQRSSFGSQPASAAAGNGSATSSSVGTKQSFGFSLYRRPLPRSLASSAAGNLPPVTVQTGTSVVSSQTLPSHAHQPSSDPGLARSQPRTTAPPINTGLGHQQQPSGSQLSIGPSLGRPNIGITPAPHPNLGSGPVSNIQGVAPSRTSIATYFHSPQMPTSSMGRLGCHVPYYAPKTCQLGPGMPPPVILTPSGMVPQAAHSQVWTQMSNNSDSKVCSGSRFMFLAKVLVGRSTGGNERYRRPPPLDMLDPFGKCYDSCVNNIFEPTIFVIFDSNQAYPEYIIEYKYAE